MHSINIQRNSTCFRRIINWFISQTMLTPFTWLLHATMQTRNIPFNLNCVALCAVARGIAYTASALAHTRQYSLRSKESFVRLWDVTLLDAMPTNSLNGVVWPDRFYGPANQENESPRRNILTEEREHRHPHKTQ